MDIWINHLLGRYVNLSITHGVKVQFDNLRTIRTYSFQSLMFPSEIYARILYFCDAHTTLDALCVPDIYDSVGPALLVQAHARRNVKTWCNSLPRIPAQYHDLYIRTCLGWGADVRANDDYAVQWASNNGHLETVKYLVSREQTFERTTTLPCDGRATTVIWKR